MQGKLKRKAVRRRGIAAVEMALISPVLFMFVFGIIELSRLGMVTQALTNAARDGCRVAVLPNNATTDVQSRLNASLTAFGVAPGTLSAVDTDPGTNGAWIMPSNWATASGGTAVTLTVRLPFTQVSWLPSPFFLSTAVVTGSATLSSERP
jgi:Flp pilus assembly protein TadG